MTFKECKFYQDYRKEFVKVFDSELYKSINENPICKHFGCGKKINRTEFLYGLKCLKHATIIKF